MSEPEPVEYGLVMPFVVTESHGGPYADGAFVGGWRLGQIDTVLSMAKHLRSLGASAEILFTQPWEMDHPEWPAVQRQLDLMAMHYGMSINVTEHLIDGIRWASVTFAMID